MADTNLFGGSFTPFRDIWQDFAGSLGIETKRMRLDALEAAAQEEAVWRDANEQLHGSLAAQQELAYTPEDLSTLATLQTQATIADRMRQSPNEAVRDAGMRMFSDILAAQRDFAQKQEADRIAAETLRADTSLGAENLRYERDMKLSNDLRRDVVTPFQQQMLNFSKARELLATGDRLGYDFAFTMAIQSLDGSVVRDSERLAYTGSSGLTAQAVDLFNKWQGERSEEAEAALVNAVEAMYGSTVETYRGTVDTFRRQTEAYGGDWGRVGSVVPEFSEWYDGGGRRGSPGGGTEAGGGPLEAAARELGDTPALGELERVEPSLVGRLAGDAVRGGFMITDEMRMQLEGSELVRAADGRMYERRPDGSLKPREAARNVFRDDGGRTVELVDLGGGRAEWRVIDEGGPPEPGIVRRAMDALNDSVLGTSPEAWQRRDELRQRTRERYQRQRETIMRRESRPTND